MIKKLFTFCLISFCCINANAGYICREIESNVNCYPLGSADWECTVPKSSNIQVKGIAQCKKTCEDNFFVCQTVSNSGNDNVLCHCRIVWPIVPGYSKYVKTYASEIDCKQNCVEKCRESKDVVLNYLYDETARPNFE